MDRLDDDIRAFDAMRSDLEAHHQGKWVIIRERALIGAFDTFDSAAVDAVRRFARGPYLIRQVGAPPEMLPASVMYYPAHATGKERV